MLKFENSNLTKLAETHKLTFAKTIASYAAYYKIIDLYHREDITEKEILLRISLEMYYHVGLPGLLYGALKTHLTNTILQYKLEFYTKPSNVEAFITAYIAFLDKLKALAIAETNTSIERVS